MRNPDWEKDELILAMALYFRAGRRALDARNPEVQELSRFLIARRPNERGQAPTFRNANGVAMKLSNFSSVDPLSRGAGLPRGNSLERAVWEEFAKNPDRLYEAAAAILENPPH